MCFLLAVEKLELLIYKKADLLLSQLQDKGQQPWIFPPGSSITLLI
jgi:hypothetical protein